MVESASAATDKFFVSYSSFDADWAKWIVWELENARARYRCIAQFKDFAPGMSFMQKMREAAAAFCTLAVFSSSYFRSNYCLKELDAAMTGEDSLLPVRVQACDPGKFLKNRIYIDLVDKPLDEARSALLGGVDAYVTVTRKPGNKAAFRQRPVFPGSLGNTAPMRSLTDLAPQGKALKVLLLGPQVGGLAPRDQLREMRRAVAQARFPGSVYFKGVFQVYVSTLFRELNQESPDVLHLTGKQNGGDVLFRTEEGGLTAVSDAALAGMLQSLDQGLKLVVIDTCFSLRCATAIAKVAPCAMGVEGEIFEDDATSFYSIFYQAIASGRSLKDAAGQARASLEFKRIPDRDIPRLICRPDMDPGKVFLADAKSVV